MSLTTTLVQRAWMSLERPAWRRFGHALKRPGEIQRQRLRTVLRVNAETAFGRRHGFAELARHVDPAPAYQQRLPPAEHAAFEPWIRRIRAGEREVLTREPVRRLVPTGGSTTARKLIPYTSGLLREMQSALGAWLVDLHRRFPGLTGGRSYWSITPPAAAGERGEEPRGDEAVPIGFDSDTAYLGGWLSRLADLTLVAPASVGRITDPAAFFRETLKHLVRARDLRLISVWHPTYLGLLLDHLEADFEEIAGEAGRRDLQSLGLPSPDDRWAWRERWPDLWPRIWPRLSLLSCWGDAGAAGALAELRRRLPGLAVQPKGLLATEGFVTVPFAGAHPLAVTSHFYEFLDGEGRPYLADELTEGGEYEVLLTTGGGLYRYRLGDRVRVEGALESTPCLRFVGKGDQVSDLRGEKLHADHVERVLQTAFEGLGLAPHFAMLAPEGGEPPAYTLYLELENEPTPSALRDLHRDLLRNLEDGLGENPGYRHARALGQLGPPSLFLVKAGGHAAYLRRRQELGQALGDIKPSGLAREGGWAERFRGRFAPG